MSHVHTEVLAQGLLFPEGPVWYRDTREWWFVELKGGHVSKVDAAGRLERVFDTPAPNGMKRHADGSFWICERDRKGLLRFDPTTRQAALIAEGCGGQPFLGPNDLCFGIAERCYFTDPHGSSRTNPAGALYRRDRDGKVTREASGLAYPNGVALTPDGTCLVFAETHTQTIWIADRQPDGSLGGRRPFARTDGGNGPDGMAFDAAGNLFVAVYGAGHVQVFDAQGRETERLDVPGKQPTNCCFGGKDFKTLCVTEAERGQLLGLELSTAGFALPPVTSDSVVF